MNNNLSWFTVRPIRWCWRLVWNRRMAWTLVGLLSITVLYYQWENWRSAKELAVEYHRMVARIGTDNPVELAQRPVPDAQNYFANPLIQSWATPLKPGGRAVKYTFPVKELMPACLADGQSLVREDDGLSRLNLEAWAKERAKAGQPIAAGVTALQELTQSLGDAHGMLAKLSEGLDRPYSRMIPSARELAEVQLRDPVTFQVNEWASMLRFMSCLGLHLRTAAMNGDANKVKLVAAIMLRFAEAAQGQKLPGALVSMATHRLSFSALHQALGYSVWTDASLVEFTRRLAALDDGKVLQHALAEETLQLSQFMTFFRERNGVGFAQALADPGENADRFIDLYARLPPRGWIDTSHAFVIREMLFFMGPRDATAWLDGDKRSMQLKHDCATQWKTLRPLLGTALIGNFGNLWGAAAETSFQRRCVIAGCALERYRLRTGGYPASLDEAKAELSSLNVSDPARPDRSLCYRRDADGYNLWSIGQDQKDDGGSAEKDWLWCIKHEASPKP